MQHFNLLIIPYERLLDNLALLLISSTKPRDVFPLTLSIQCPYVLSSVCVCMRVCGTCFLTPIILIALSDIWYTIPLPRYHTSDISTLTKGFIDASSLYCPSLVPVKKNAHNAYAADTLSVNTEVQDEEVQEKGMNSKECREIAKCICRGALCCTVLYCTVLYCTTLYCTVLYCTVLYCTVL